MKKPSNKNQRVFKITVSRGVRGSAWSSYVGVADGLSKAVDKAISAAEKDGCEDAKVYAVEVLGVCDW